KRDPKDRARLLMVRIPGRTSDGDLQGYLPLLGRDDPKLPDWEGQEATGFPDNWTVGISFFHNVFAREHNQFVAAFRQRAATTPDADCGLRDPVRPDRVIRYRDVTPDQLFEVARLVVSAEIAKIHTIEWTTQLLYNEPLFLGMNANWGGLPGKQRELPGIVGTGSHTAGWSVANPDDVNGGTNHFGSPFQFPEEFVSVYRLHTLLPDVIEYRDARAPNAIAGTVPVVQTFRGKATAFTRDRGLANWALSLGRQRVGTVQLQNAPRFLQNIRIARLPGTGQIDIVALDLVRDRERGVPRFNEFRRQYGLPSLTSYDELVGDATLASTLRGLYGQHRCDRSKVITRAQRNADKTPITDCLGRPDGTLIDNIEDVDTMVGWLGESTRPHGFAISETQFVVFILNASRRLYSDRFLTSSFRPEFYTTMGLGWVNDNGPGPMTEPAPINGHAAQPVSPLKRVLMRTIPELAAQLAPLHNAFDPWARDPGVYYSLQWKPRPGAETDPAFAATVPSAAAAPRRR
ncbi:MAG TPA: peroxidase family protein, partial [Vicinamibacterales bacterium]